MDVVVWRILDTSMGCNYPQPVMFLNDEERRRVEDKALEQILKMAQLARVDPADLGLIVDASWPFELTDADRVFLRMLVVCA